MNYSENKIVVNDLSINVRSSGKGRHVLFLHGAGGVLEWTPFLDDLSQNCSLCVPDHPGFGKSDDPEWITNISDLAMYYLDFFDQAAPPEGFDVVGHSLGGWIAAEIAVRKSGNQTGR